MTQIQDLIERVEKASGVDREIDCYIEAFVSRYTPNGQFHIVGPPTYEPPRFFYNPSPSINWIGYDLLNTSPFYTTSVSATLDLTERMLPGWRRSINEDGHGAWRAAVMSPVEGAFPAGWNGAAKSPALALLAATLRALQDKESVT